MQGLSLKRYMPRSLYGRAALILLLPIVTIQLVVSVVFIQRLYEDVTVQMTQNVLLEIRFVQQEIDAAPDLDTALAAIGPIIEPLVLRVAPAEPGAVAADTRLFYDLSGRVVIETLRDGLGTVRGIDLSRNSKQVSMVLGTRHGDLQVSFARRRVSASNPHQLLVLMVLTSALLTIVAYLFLRNQLRPIKRLAAAAEAFGKGRTVPYRPSGALEVRSAGGAFLDMRSRIERQIEQRTLMLSGVSHDLRTPLTRLRLGLSMIEDQADIADLQRDVADMERMLDAFLSFAKADALDDPEAADPAVLARRVVDKAARAQLAVTLGEISGEGSAQLRPMAVERALENLIGNAVRYGTRARLSMVKSGRAVRFTVEDDGPGIPPGDREHALRPFARLDSARNQNRGPGVGLGLSIANDIARQHGGMLRLGESEDLGGLRVDLVLAQ